MSNIYQQLLARSDVGEALKQNHIGLERESLRTDDKGAIALSAHPQSLGSTLTHPYITTDFSESLIEIVTPPLQGADATLNFLEQSLAYVTSHLHMGEKLWGASMPCVINGKSQINIAHYGSSNQGKMKEIYRKGLALRYGKEMQVVAGIHFNYSFSDDFWRILQSITGCNTTLQAYKNVKYMHLIRNVLRYGWILYYFFGASNSVCKSFLHIGQHHNFKEFDEFTLYNPHATSLRMSDIGYQNSKEDESGIKANYNSVMQYAHSLQDAMRTSFAEYEAMGIKENGEYLQLNDSILQIENEYYSSIRPKPTHESGVMPSQSLLNNGIEYIELRTFDINPLTPLGITKEQILFTESFLLMCVLEDSKPLSTREHVEIDRNNLHIATHGMDPRASVMCHGKSFVLGECFDMMEDKLTSAALMYSEEHHHAVTQIYQSGGVAKTLLHDMQTKQQGFNTWANALSTGHDAYFKGLTIDPEFSNMMDQLGAESLTKQKQLEQSTEDFDTYLQNYFSQL